MLNTQITLPLDEIRHFCEEQTIRKLSLFGSVLRDDFNAASDVDVLVEFEPGAIITYFDLFDMQERLTAIIGHQVDLLTPAALSPYFRDDVLNQAVAVYERE